MMRKAGAEPSRALLTCLAVTWFACGGAGRSSSGPPVVQSTGTATAAPCSLTSADIGALAAIFSDQPFIGGQVAPLLMKWTSDSTFVFLELNGPAGTSRTVAYLGLGVKGTFCAETRPDLVSLLVCLPTYSRVGMQFPVGSDLLASLVRLRRGTCTACTGRGWLLAREAPASRS